MTNKTNEKTRRGIGPGRISDHRFGGDSLGLRPFITPLLGGMLQPGQTRLPFGRYHRYPNVGS